MVNLFRQATAGQGGLTASLLALLEHGDRELLNGLLRRAGVDYPAAGGEVKVQFPAPDGPPGAGLIASPHFRLTIAAPAPGEPYDAGALADQDGTPLAITLAGQAPPGGHGLSWEQLDRWLAGAQEQYDPDSRTGFLIRQFRAVLPEFGIEYFAGFDPDLLERAPRAFATLTRFLQTAAQFCDRFGPALAAGREGSTAIRQARPEEQLAGYWYRDFSDPAGGPGGFLRIAFPLGESQLHLIYWLTPAGNEAHTRLRELFLDDEGFRNTLAELRQNPLLWLWGPAGDRKLPLADLHPADLEGIDWPQHHVGLQVSLPFAELPGEDLVGRVMARLTALLEALAPVLSTLLH
jgi:hypothetical protein